jgi:toxin ParE1/3/4
VTRKRAPKRPARARPSQRIYWTSRALSDLEAIGDYIARDNPAAAERWVMRLIAVAENAAITPLAGRRVPELGRDDVRETSLRTYRIVYRVTGEQFEILTVFEGHRLFPDDVALPEGED